MTVPPSRRVLRAFALAALLTLLAPLAADALAHGSPTAVPPRRAPSAQDASREDPSGSEADEAKADDTEPAVRAVPGRTILGGLISRGFAQEINGSLEIDVTTVALRWSRIFGSPEKRFLGALPGLGVEVIPAMLFDQEPTAWSGGFHLLYEHRFVTEGVLPTLRLGAGFVYGNREVPPGETRHNFSLLAGLGIDVPVTDTSALGIEYRLHHVSNADTGLRNPGINAHTLALGLSVYF